MRGTIAALGNAVMYSGNMIGSTLIGLLYTAADGFEPVGLGVALCVIFALFLLRSSRLVASKPARTVAAAKDRAVQ